MNECLTNTISDNLTDYPSISNLIFGSACSNFHTVLKTSLSFAHTSYLRDIFAHLVGVYGNECK